MFYIQMPNETDSQSKMWSTKTHGLITLPIASAGVFLNLMIITIFVQKSMRTHTNHILMTISIFDLLMMISYIPYSIYFCFARTPDPYPDQSLFWPYFLLIYNHFSIFTHACSVSKIQLFITIDSLKQKYTLIYLSKKQNFLLLIRE